MTENKWGDTFYYDETSPSCLRWARDSYSGRSNGKLQVAEGHVAGSPNDNGQWEVYAEGRLQQTHRIVYEIWNGPIPEGKIIDHIDGNRSNNKIGNLRVVDHVRNARNRKKSDKNSSGFTGVYWTETISKNGFRNLYAVGFVQGLNGYKKTSKHFPVSKLGLLEAFAAACKWRLEQITKLNEQGAGYTEDHGVRQ